MDAALIVIVVALGDADDPATRAMTRTTQEVLGDTSLVIVREVPAMPTDDCCARCAALRPSNSAHASFHSSIRAIKKCFSATERATGRIRS